MAKLLSKQNLMEWYTNSIKKDVTQIPVTERNYTKKDGTPGVEFVSDAMKTKAYGCTVIPVPSLGMDKAIVTLGIVRAERIGDARFNELMAECAQTGDYNPVRNYLSIPGVALATRSCFGELATVQEERDVTVHLSKREVVNDEGTIETYYSFEVDAVKPLASLTSDTAKTAEEVFEM